MSIMKKKYIGIALEVILGDILTVRNGKKSTMTLKSIGDESICYDSEEVDSTENFDEDFYYEDELYTPENYDDYRETGIENNYAGIQNFQSGANANTECNEDINEDLLSALLPTDNPNCAENENDVSDGDTDSDCVISEDGSIHIGSIRNFKIGTDASALSALRRLCLYGSLICLDGEINIKGTDDIEKFSSEYFQDKKSDDKVAVYVDCEDNVISISAENIADGENVKQVRMTLESVQCLYLLDLLNRDLTIYK